MENIDHENAVPQRPVTPEYEDITIRFLTVGFSGGTQELTLYPEDVMESDDAGNIRVVFHTDEEAEFVAYAGHTQWHGLKRVSHKRQVGTLRPNPTQMIREREERRKEAYRLDMESRRRRLESDVDGD
jgi:hypothetical protein